MRFVNFSLGTGGARHLGVVLDGALVLDLVPALQSVIDVPNDLRDYIAAGPDLHRRVAQAVATTQSWPTEAIRSLDEVVLHAPFRPGKLIGVGLNYVEHVEESSRSLDTDENLPTRPVLFSTPGTAVIGPDEPILHNSELTEQLDWECELAVIIGDIAKSVTEDDAMNHVFGYSIVNDISARDQRRSGQWFFSKGQDSYKPFGPMVVTADELGDPHTLQLSLTVNGEQRQNGNSRHMLFKIPQLIADITSGVTLEPGDIIATGSPQGVGAAMTPPTYLTPGDVVAATIEKIGTLANPVKAV
ncbi:fumarylacetoacetate hydrolase family protein [Nocardia vermiculata]|uniref:Fumarylacetoacetate hydrolase family protein n=1 Tax=Nocardia vermiculata TaxID=257274 RepID=A0A846Y5R1_9NOCA|nr:fumarylacetoacetate hydrolase family protein [Nocardia vermiculata]NKY54543.1 fumarylacetoacetate hydrolase family protein [Nocardia vermiculata]